MWLSLPVISLLTVFLYGTMNGLLHLLFTAFCICAVISAVNLFCISALRKIGENSLRRRGILHAGVLCAFTLLFIVAATVLLTVAEVAGLQQAAGFSIATALLCLVTNAAATILYFLRLWKESILQGEALKHEILAAQLEGIRQQLSPHFFFNSLNSLTLVIEEDPAEAVRYVHHIAHLYRYLLQSKDVKVVPLQNELRFAESYIYLQKMRFGKALDMTIAIDKSEMQNVIPPLTLYILLENALKHNIITKSKPLHIRVFIKDGKLRISNNIQTRVLPEDESVIRLRTVRTSYQSVSEQPLQVTQDEENFMVSLPLIKELSQTA